MKLPSYIRLSRHHVYCFRRRIPHDLLGIFPVGEVRHSLKTKDRKIAVQRARELALRIDLLFERVRAMANNKNDEDEGLRFDLTVAVEAQAPGLNFKIDYDPLKPEERDEADRRLAELHKLLPSQPAQRIQVALPSESLAVVIQAFFDKSEIGRRRDKAATVRKDQDALRLFSEVVGAAVPAMAVAQEHAVKFANTLESRGLAANTKNNHMGAVSKFSQWMTGWRPELGHKKLDFRALRFKVEKRSDEQREAFSDDEVLRILRDEQFLAFRTSEPHKFWFTYIAAYAGMRVRSNTPQSSTLNSPAPVYG